MASAHRPTETTTSCPTPERAPATEKTRDCGLLRVQELKYGGMGPGERKQGARERHRLEREIVVTAGVGWWERRPRRMCRILAAGAGSGTSTSGNGTGDDIGVGVGKRGWWRGARVGSGLGGSTGAT
ncbi:hypothetical protein LshimejAT787_2500180 [Lyophyllum shimeji]|uniref:Uncharacterized protein n=1 Tax=Lyophyllum shimeji TaxID=47721 RepID=A0A9P3UWZ5_LYOSH|nr:hypothetical protein LshimejAT787_2500180 [Lyophyllum shimeji]